MRSPIEKKILLTLDEQQFNIVTRFRAGGDTLILCIHGLGCSKDIFNGIWEVPELDKSSVMTFDLPGFGESDKPEDFLYRMEDQASVCEMLVSSIPFNTIHIIAHSMGGVIGTILAELIPDRLDVFINVEGNLTEIDSWLSGEVARTPFAEFKEIGFSELLTSFDNSPECASRLWATLSRMSTPESFFNSAASLVEWSMGKKILERFKALSCRKLYLHGEKSMNPEIIKLLAGVNTVSVSQSGHFPMIDNPCEFYATIISLL